MDYTYSEWLGYNRADFKFEGRDALIKELGDIKASYPDNEQIITLYAEAINDILAAKTIDEIDEIIQRFDEDAKSYLVSKGFDAKFGARPLKRLIQKEIESELDEFYINVIVKINSSVFIGAKNDSLTYNIE